MSDPVHRSPEHPTHADFMSPGEKLIAEWEARHDVAARGRRIDPAAALQHYLSHTRCEEGLHHHERPEHPSRASGRHRHADPFAAEHPFTASWVRWGEDPR
ncbi:hypothetical protein ACI79C_07325 [Geodermatophilus sp. SYSU D00697]